MHQILHHSQLYYKNYTSDTIVAYVFIITVNVDKASINKLEVNLKNLVKLIVFKILVIKTIYNMSPVCKKKF